MTLPNGRQPRKMIGTTSWRELHQRPRPAWQAETGYLALILAATIVAHIAVWLTQAARGG